MAFSQQQITEKVSAYLQHRFLSKNVRFDAEMAFSEFGIDSMTVVELVMFIEEEFGISIPADQLTGENLRSLHSLTNCALRNQADS